MTLENIYKTLRVVHEEMKLILCAMPVDDPKRERFIKAYASIHPPLNKVRVLVNQEKESKKEGQ